MRICGAYEHEPAECLVGLHAAKSAASIIAFRERNPNKRIVLVLTGTDVYRDIRKNGPAKRALQIADVLVTLQPDAIGELPRTLRSKAVAIIQSAAPAARRRRTQGAFTICVLGHLRYEKDPMRAAYALRTLPHDLNVRVVQAGRILDQRYEDAAAREIIRNARYDFRGELSRTAARRLLAGTDLLVQSSRMEGGANAICEAIATGVPVVASRVSGNVGILGRNYPGLYQVGNTTALAALLRRAATSATFYAKLQAACGALKPLVSPARERRLWAALLR